MAQPAILNYGVWGFMRIITSMLDLIMGEAITFFGLNKLRSGEIGARP